MNDIEAVARAICAANGVDPDELGPGVRHVIEEDGIPTIISDHQGPLWKMWEAHARAATETIIERWMEPTEGMGDAALRAMNDTLQRTGGYAVNSQEIWQAMLRAKLEEIKRE